MSELPQVQCQALHDSFISPYWTNPTKNAIKALAEPIAAHLAAIGCVKILEPEKKPEKKSGSSAHQAQASKKPTSKPRGKKPTK